MTLGPGKGGRSGVALRPSKMETKTGVTGWRRWRSPGRDTEDTARRSMPRRPLRSRLAMRRTAPVREPLTSSAETKNVRAVRGGGGGGVQEIGFCTKGYILVISPFYRWYITPLQDGKQ